MLNKHGKRWAFIRGPQRRSWRTPRFRPTFGTKTSRNNCQREQARPSGHPMVRNLSKPSLPELSELQKLAVTSDVRKGSSPVRRPGPGNPRTRRKRSSWSPNSSSTRRRRAERCFLEQDMTPDEVSSMLGTPGNMLTMVAMAGRNARLAARKRRKSRKGEL
jgi:hypothetical protein